MLKSKQTSLIGNTILTVKQDLFIEHYMANGGNGVQAAKSAGYEGNTQTLSSVAKENLQKPLIKEELETFRQDIKDKLGITSSWKRKKLKQVIDAGVKLKLTEGGKSMVDAKSVISAIEVLNKMDGDYVKRSNDNQGQVRIVIDELDMAL